MIHSLKVALKSFLGKYTPLYLKKSLLEIWHENDDEFWLHSKIVLNGNGDLFRHRFLWSDLSLPIQSIKARFGADQKIFLLTDRADFPKDEGLLFTSTKDLYKLSREEVHVVICAYESDEKLFDAVQIIKGMQNVFYYCPFRYIPTARYLHRNTVARETLIRELNINLGKFDLPDFENIMQALEITKRLDGDYVEIGVYRGDSAHAALEYMKAAGIKRKSYFFDLFKGFTNQSSEQSKDAVWLDSHIDTSFEFVEQLLQGYDNVTVSKLDIIADELPSAIAEIALCNIDVDLYEAIIAALEKVGPRVKKGGIIILEDQGHTPFLAGAFTATMEYISKAENSFVPIQMSSGQMFLVKI